MIYSDKSYSTNLMLYKKSFVYQTWVLTKVFFPFANKIDNIDLKDDLWPTVKR